MLSGGVCLREHRFLRYEGQDGVVELQGRSTDGGEESDGKSFAVIKQRCDPLSTVVVEALLKQ